MIEPSAEQSQITEAPLIPMSVIACAGSGKTFTAVRRLAQMRRQLGEHRGRVALLSFSNVAVDTFRHEYQNLVQSGGAGVAHGRVEISTLDGFITSNVLRPHAHRTMGAPQSAFLVMGGEAFLSGFKFQTDTYPHEITKMQVGIESNQVYFCYSDNDRTHRLNREHAESLVHRLGRVGAYTHNLGRYWCYRTLKEQPRILSALVRRYPHILIDEAQDIGTMHQAVIEQLVVAGCQISLIGDPNQGIYDFAGATGVFLSRYGQIEGRMALDLTTNYRSVPAIVNLANRLSGRVDTANRVAPTITHGAYFVPYRNSDRENLITTFKSAVLAADLKLEHSAVLCRSRDMANKLSDNESAPGQGTVKWLAQAAILRDRHQDYLAAFKLVTTALVSLMAEPPNDLVAKITHAARYSDDQALRRLLWAFTRSPDSGLPSSTLIADRQWHMQLLNRTKALLTVIEQEHGLRSVDNVGRKLAKTGLQDAPLIPISDTIVNGELPSIRVDTVHGAKGESLDAVLYLATKEHVKALLDGVGTEVGRIGYVAVTRARNLIWLGVPANSLKELQPALLDVGFQQR